MSEQASESLDTVPAPSPRDAEPMTDGLVVSGLSVHYGGVQAVNSISFTVGTGQCVGIIGANGAGKTSTLKALMGLVPRTAEAIRFGEHDLTRVRPRNIVRCGIGYVPEGRHVFPGLTVEKNLLLGAYVRPWRGPTLETMTEVFDLFPMLGEMRHRLAGALSGGQQQMLSVGRALMSRPKLILLDEPSMGLSPKLIENILAVLHRLRAAGHALLLVEQNAKLTFEATETCLVIENGQVAMTGTSTSLRADPRVRQIYLGL
ncbi:MAG TPA: ABC transporter ATP-binding protein [Actinophytocola sp.]|uniref:ABC transporter ATP-binding protein n=1 Tax=Actinophytocola sp. TaxID=1872138 RepID=UPI002DB6BC84|nr:ABC transporter ATP-binding protein [Actinophytocola sp.]HEU5470721.1 ABC transporter ATP-binding protein [Actinophytocola sp.]